MRHRYPFYCDGYCLRKLALRPEADWLASFRGRLERVAIAKLDTAIAEITKKTDISIQIESLERSKHRRVTSVTFVIKEQPLPDGK
jgi:CRISPR/Cas system-associated endoribonuclease Cas2